jgi:hypothetical protein
MNQKNCFSLSFFDVTFMNFDSFIKNFTCILMIDEIVTFFSSPVFTIVGGITTLIAILVFAYTVFLFFKVSPTWRFFKPSLSPARTRFKEITNWAKIGFC